MRHLPDVLRNLSTRRTKVLDELHPELRALVLKLEDACGYRVVPWCGFRSKDEQEKAKAGGFSNAGFGQSPHNYRPALACDLVLHPGRVAVREHPDAPGWPDLWDRSSKAALDAWALLEDQATALGLERVDIGRAGRRTRDWPHVQLRSWRSYLPQ